MLHSRRR